MGVNFGISTNQIPTSLVPPVSVDGSLPMAFGCAPIHRLAPEDRARAIPGKIVLCYSDAEAGQKLGIMASRDDFTKWGLSEVAFSSFALYGKAPVIFANVFDPAKHFLTKTDESVIFTLDTAALNTGDVLDNLTLKDMDATAYVEGTDYTINRISGIITAIEDSSLALAISAGKGFLATYDYAAPELVTPEDVIGGYDVETGITSGLELVEQAFPQFRMVPGILLAPNFSQDATVAMILAAKAVGINAVFNCVAYADLPTDNLTAYTDVPAYKAKNGLTSENLYLCWPKVLVGNRRMNLSTHAAGVTAVEDNRKNGIPYSTPSNKNVQCQAVVTEDGQEIFLTVPMANDLRDKGIATVLNFTSGNCLWGAYTAAYPGNTDSKDSFLSSRRMLAWYANRLVLTYWNKIDEPNNRLLIQTIANSEQMTINALASVGALAHGSSIAARDDENSVLSLMAGQLTFHVMLGLIMPAQKIQFNLEFDPYLLQNLFA